MKYDNFIYLTQENQGQSVARNYGIRECHGEYLWCVDSDDMLIHDLYYIFSFLENHPDADIIKTVIETFEEGQPATFEQRDGSYTHKSGRELLQTGYHPQSVCNMIVRRSILIDNNLRFIPGITSQDTELSHRIYYYAKSVYTFDYVTYLYMHNPFSTTQSKDAKKLLRKDISNITISKSFYSFSEHIKETDPELSLLFYQRSNNILLGMLFTMIRKRKERKGTDINNTVLDEMKQQGVYPIKKGFDSVKKNMAISLLNIELLLKWLI
jgi:glycosyltransferase involved in cell wall biosynthesis